MNDDIRRIAILGNGPAAATLGSLLANEGYTVVIFAKWEAADAASIGEFVPPAAVQILRQLDMENDVEEIGVRLDAVSYFEDAGRSSALPFTHLQKMKLPDYGYGVPRAEFDKKLMACALRCGAERVAEKAVLERSERNEITLARESLVRARSLQGKQPNLIIDASGHEQIIAQFLELPQTASRASKRKTVVYTAFFKDLNDKSANSHLQMGRVKNGWSWMIPCKEGCTIGIAISEKDKKKSDQPEKTPEEQFDEIIASEPLFLTWGATGRRTGAVVSEPALPRQCNRSTWANWALTGNALGFTGSGQLSEVWLEMRGAEILAEAIMRNAYDPAIYDRRIRYLMSGWTRLMHRHGRGQVWKFQRSWLAKNFVTRPLHRHFERQLTQLISGADCFYARSMMRLAHFVHPGKL